MSIFSLISNMNFFLRTLLGNVYLHLIPISSKTDLIRTPTSHIFKCFFKDKLSSELILILIYSLLTKFALLSIYLTR